MAVSGFSLLLAAVSALAAVATIALPVTASADPGRADAAALRTTQLSADELAGTLRPAETPPPDFTASQYIDSAGCVFVRTEHGWRPRVGSDHAPVCGYPPTLSARRTDSGATAALFPTPAEPRGDRIRRELTEAIIPNLQTGELAASQTVPHGAGRDSGAGAAAPPVQDTLALGKMMAHGPELSRQMVGRAHLDRVCALIGGSPQAGGGGALGLCGPGSATLVPVVTTPPAATRTAQVVGPDNNAPAAPNVKARPRPDTAAAQVVKSGGEDPRMIPPGARYVQIGGVRDAAMAESTARKLAGTGLPVVRTRAAEGQVGLILIGPLDGREAVVRMIDRLRNAGYRDVTARR